MAAFLLASACICHYNNQYPEQSKRKLVMSHDVWLDIDSIIENQLSLQVAMSYNQHHRFMLQTGLDKCRKVLDIGTGNGLFLQHLALDHAAIDFTGIDKRQHLLDRCASSSTKNISVQIVDVQENKDFDFSVFDGVLMRYFLLHLPNAKELLGQIKKKSKPGTHVWVIDVDPSHFCCTPENENFKLFEKLFREVCDKNSIDTFAGQKLGPIFEELGYKEIAKLDAPFNTKEHTTEQMVTFLKQELICYSTILGHNTKEPEIARILNFFEAEVPNHKVEISYGMVLWHAMV